jgi:hypothetical protein
MATLPYHEQLRIRLRTLTEEINRMASRAEPLMERINRCQADFEDMIVHATLETAIQHLERHRAKVQSMYDRARRFRATAERSAGR